jgi:hypothetical protein
MAQAERQEIKRMLDKSRKRTLRYIHHYKDILRYMGPDCGMARRWGYGVFRAVQ